MPSKTVVAKYINSGVGKNNKPYHNIKTPEDEVFWARNAITGISQGALVEVNYTVGHNGSNNIVSVKPVTNGTGGQPNYRAETPSKDAERMFVTALLKSYVEAELLPLETMAILKGIRIVSGAYHQAYDAPQIQTRADRPPDDGLDDEIPY